MSRDNITTTDLSEFGFREISMARDLLSAYLDNNHAEMLGDGVQVMMNKNSGHVFLTDEDCNVAMEQDGKLLDWLTSPYGGKEGFWEDLVAEMGDMHPEDKQWMRDMASTFGHTFPDERA